jgi:hypothetical protein
VSKVETESVATLASTRGEADGFARKVALLEGEFADALQAHDRTEANSDWISFPHMNRDVG